MGWGSVPLDTVDRSNPAYKHGHAGRGKFSPEYQSWATMIQRCTNPRVSSFRWYGGRGITVCKRWTKFENFLADMGARPKGKTLDRKNNDKGYYKRNCQWASRVAQARNSKQVMHVTIGRKTKKLVEWCEEIGISINTVRCRVRTHGWSYQDALLLPRQDMSKRGPRGRLAKRSR